MGAGVEWKRPSEVVRRGHDGYTVGVDDVLVLRVSPESRRGVDAHRDAGRTKPVGDRGAAT